MILSVQNIESLINVLKPIYKFYIPAGPKVNVSKTECILHGPFRNMFILIEGIIVTNILVQCIDIYVHVGHDKTKCYNKNWMKNLL